MSLVRSSILMLVLLNKLVINVVSFPMYVNVAHFFVGVCVVCCCFCSLGWCSLCGCMGKELL